MVIDVHAHHTFTALAPTVEDRFSFEPASTAAARRLPTDHDSCVSPRALRRLNWRLARWYLGLPEPGPALDTILAAQYDEHLLAAGPIERTVLLAFDAVFDDDGQCLPLPRPGDRVGSDIYSSNSLIREKCRRHPGRFLFGASVHPYRPNAPALVEEVFAGGASLLKWIPQHHNIDANDERTLAVLRKCAELGLPLLVHYGEEFSLATQFPRYQSLGPMLETLRSLRKEGTLPTVIVAHAATPVKPWAERRSHRMLMEALSGDFADAPLYTDISALTAPTKVGDLRRLARRRELHAKLLFGSDFPIPPTLWALRRDLGRHYASAAAVRSWPQQMATAFRLLGFEEIVFHRAAELLPNVNYFAATPTEAVA